MRSPLSKEKSADARLLSHITPGCIDNNMSNNNKHVRHHRRADSMKRIHRRIRFCIYREDSNIPNMSNRIGGDTQEKCTDQDSNKTTNRLSRAERDVQSRPERISTTSRIYRLQITRLRRELLDDYRRRNSNMTVHIPTVSE